MAEDKVEPREINWRRALPWTVIFQGFRVALDPSKMLLAAAGILCMSLGWWLLGAAFHYDKPSPSDSDYQSIQFMKAANNNEQEAGKLAWEAFRQDRVKWNLLHEAAGRNDRKEFWEPEDFAATRAELDTLKAWNEPPPRAPEGVEIRSADQVDRLVEEKKLTVDQGRTWKFYLSRPAPAPLDVREIAQVDQQLKDNKITAEQANYWKVSLKKEKPTGRMRTLPWYENRGPNPALLVSGQAGKQWEKGGFLDWMLNEQLPVLLEPLVKLFLPFKYLFHPRTGMLTRLYALLVLLWTVAVWGLFGGAITRIAAVQVARQEKISLMEAVRFALRRYLSYVMAPLAPLLLVVILLVLMILFGFVHMIPIFGDVIDGLFWPLVIGLGLAMAIVLVGLVCWPLMAATISTEGTDAWEAVSRSYSYVYQAPWQYIWYLVTSLAYGAVVVFFVGLMGSLTVYLSKWGVSQTPGLDSRVVDREPSYLFVYAPTSFGWRELLLQGAKVDGNPIVEQGEIVETRYDDYVDKLKWYNQIGAVLVSVVWIGLIFMMIIGFGYSYFWTSSTIIYLLMRREVDDAELDEVYLEDEDDGPYSGPLTPPIPPVSGPTTTAPSTSLPVIEPPRPTATPVAPPSPPPSPAPSPPPPSPPAPPPDGGATP